MTLPQNTFLISRLAIVQSTKTCSHFNEKGVIKETQDKIAQKATNNIKDPVDKAKIAAELINEHNQKVEEGQ